MNNLKQPDKKELIDKTQLLKKINELLKEIRQKKEHTIKRKDNEILGIDEMAFGYYHGQLKILNVVKKMIKNNNREVK